MTPATKPESTVAVGCKGLLAIAMLATALALDAEASVASPAKVTICHATGSASNPYETITVSENAVRDGKAHNRDGHQNGEDIIPPGPYDPDGRNWTTEGQTIYEDGCLVFLPNVLPPSR